MKNLWTTEESKNYTTDLELRVYTSQLLGRSDELVLHGGGNTSVKSIVNNTEVLYVKGSGWDLVSIEEAGFPAVELQFLKDMARLESLSDSDMVDAQRKAMINKSAPNPSVEAILHAIIPFKFVDHTHADAVVTISNSIDGDTHLKHLYPNYVIVPYVMPGFILAHTIWKMTKDINWQECEGIILHNHGIFTFDDDAKKSYDKMINAVSIAEDFLELNASIVIDKFMPRLSLDIQSLQEIISKEKGYEVIVKINQSPLALHFASQRDLNTIALKGVLTPEHIIRTKRVPLILESNNIQNGIDKYKQNYKEYFERYKQDEIMLNSSPNWIVVKNFGTISIGKNEKEAIIIEDINNHTMRAILKAQKLGGYVSISEKDSFDMEYWELEQNKLKK